MTERLNEPLHIIIKMVNSSGEETMKYEHPQCDILRLTNLIQIFSSGRYDTDVRMTVDIAYPADEGVPAKGLLYE